MVLAKWSRIFLSGRTAAAAVYTHAKLQLVLSDAPQSMRRCPVRQKPPPRNSPSIQEQLRPDVLPGRVGCSLQRASQQQQQQAGVAEPSERFAHNHIFASVIPVGVTSLADRMERGRWAWLRWPRKYPPIAAPRSRCVTRGVTTARPYSQRTAMDRQTVVLQVFHPTRNDTGIWCWICVLRPWQPNNNINITSSNNSILFVKLKHFR